MVQRKVMRSIVRYSVSTATAAVIVAVYFRWLHVNETTVAMTFMVGILLVAANWGLRHSIYLSILSAAAFNFFFLAASPDVHGWGRPQLDCTAGVSGDRHRCEPACGAGAP